MAAIDTLIGDLLPLIVGWRERAPADAANKRLNTLFELLRAPPQPALAFEIEDEIWELWTRGRDADQTKAMERAIALIAGKRFDDARTLLGEMIAAAPDWAEAWNKRATLHFLADRWPESLSDIARTLDLEPRHFGAITGFANIALHAGDARSAVIALRVALAINPHLVAARAMLDQLDGSSLPPLH